MISNNRHDPVTTTPPMALRNDTRHVSFLIPVDATASAYNSLTYALKLARACSARIHLVHVTDLNELVESSNPLVVNRMLGAMERKARNCVAALRELIEDSGIEVLSHDAMIGNMDAMLQKKIQWLAPDLVIVGRENFRKSTISRLIKTSSCPTLVVPSTTEARLPKNIGLCPGQTVFPYSILDSPISAEGPQIHHYPIPAPMNTRTITAFVEANSIDLLATVPVYASLLHRIMKWSRSADLFCKFDMPVMILRPDTGHLYAWPGRTSHSLLSFRKRTAL